MITMTVIRIIVIVFIIISVTTVMIILFTPVGSAAKGIQIIAGPRFATGASRSGCPGEDRPQ